MTQVFGQLLPHAFAIALSPGAYIALLLAMFGKRGRQTTPFFVLGWLLGALVMLLIVIATGIKPSTDGGNFWLQLILGLLFLALGINSWRNRPRPGVEKKPSKLMQGVNNMGPGAVFLLGAYFTTLNPKNTSLLIISGLSISSANLSGGDMTLVIIGFLLVASIVPIVIVGAFLLFGDKVQPALNKLKDWLSANSSYVMIIVFALMAASFLGKALEHL